MGEDVKYPNREVLTAVFKMDFPHAWEELIHLATSLELSYTIREEVRVAAFVWVAGKAPHQGEGARTEQ